MSTPNQWKRILEAVVAGQSGFHVMVDHVPEWDATRAIVSHTVYSEATITRWAGVGEPTVHVLAETSRDMLEDLATTLIDAGEALREVIRGE